MQLPKLREMRRIQIPAMKQVILTELQNKTIQY